MNSSGEIRLLLQSIEEAYSGKAWHGPTLRGSIRGLTAEQAAWRPARGRHNIWEIVVHCSYWKYAVRRRILGEKRGSFPIDGSNWFSRPEGKPVGISWRRDVALLDDMHMKLCSAVSTMKRSQLDQKSRGGKNVSTLRLIRGIAMHDVYHAGQIQLLKKLLPNS